MECASDSATEGSLPHLHVSQTMDNTSRVEWFQSLILFSEAEMILYKELSKNADTPKGSGTCRLLFLKKLENPMDVSFSGTIKEKRAVIALYCVKKHVPHYRKHCVCLIGFAILHDNDAIKRMTEERLLCIRSLDTSLSFISHKHILRVHRVGMCPNLQEHINISIMHGHILEQIVSRGVYLSERQFVIHLRNMGVTFTKSILHLWIMLRYTLTGFGETNVPMLPHMCMEQIELSGIPMKGDSSRAYLDSSFMNNLVPCLQAVECTPSSHKYYDEFVRYVRNEYQPSIELLANTEDKFSKEDFLWKRFPVNYTKYSHDLWSTLSELPSLHLSIVQTFVRDRLIPKHEK